MLHQLPKIRTQNALSPRRGVSLIELIMVIAISSFMIAIALAGLNNSGRSRFDDGMRQVLNRLREVQNQAANGQAPSNGLLAGQELFGKGVWFTTVPTTGYNEYFVRRPLPPTDGSTDYSGFVADFAGRDVKLPNSLKLTKIEVAGTTAPKGMIVFARREEGGSTQGQTSSSALPYFFAESTFAGLTQANNANSYISPQTATVTLSFTSADGKYTAKIIINCATGTMEITQ